MTGIMFFDWEGRGPDLPAVGTMNYVLDPRMRITLLTYNFDLEGPTKSWVPDLSDLVSEECWEMVKTLVDSHTEVPPEIVEHVESGGLVCAWNTGFDRVVWQQVATPELGFPKIGIDQTLDAMVQGLASNLPGSLHGAGLALKLGGKSASGKGAMMLFADCEKPMPEDRQLWVDYIVYGLRDTELLRDIFNVTRPLTLEEWREYWASERINDRGVGVDLDVCRGAVRYREEEKQFIAGECERLTDGAIPRPTMTTRINDWVYDILPHDLQDRMVKKRDEDGNPTNLTLAKDTLLMLLEDIKQHDAPPDDNVLEFLELLQHGRASSSVKFEKMLNQSCDGRLLGSYVFNGAGQTGRYCVARDTKVQTDTCEKFIIDLNIGDQVLTHEGRYRPVTGKIFKGKDHLFRITTEDGAYVTCTVNHRFLTPNGWKNLREYKQGAVEKCTSTCVGLPILSIGYTPDDQAADATVSDLLPYSNGNPENGNPAPGTQTFAGGEQIPVEDRTQEPDVRGSMRIRSGDAERLRLPLEQQDTEIRAGASTGGSGDAGYSGNPEGSAGTSYRRQQTEQPPRQFGYGDDTWPCSPAQTAISEIVYMGVGEVWDIEVAGDHSYVAQGLIHHNSSRGIQIHNLPRDKLKNEIELLDMVADGCPIEDIRAFGSVNHVLSRLIRPTLIAEEGNTFIWGDWSAIEARVLPWLANTRKARQTVLVPYERGEDLYVLNAAKIFNCDATLMLELITAADKSDDPTDEMLTAVKQRQAGKVACIAQGSLVLTDRGEVPIEQVRLTDRVWDGIDFVSHEGVVLQGFKEVLSYDGLEATSDHKVWVDGQPEPIQFGDAAARGERLTQSGTGRYPVRVGRNNIARAPVQESLEPMLCTDALHWLCQRAVDLFKLTSAGYQQRLSALLAPTSNTSLAGSTHDGSKEPMRQYQRSALQELRCAWCRVQVFERIRSMFMGHGELGYATSPGAGSRRQQRTLRTGEYALCRATSAEPQQTEFGGVATGYSVGGNVKSLQPLHNQEDVTQSDVARGNTGACARSCDQQAKKLARDRNAPERVAVYDIVNAGPRHRFTVNGKLVSNCLALGFGGSVGAYRAMARGYGLRTNNKEAKYIVDGWREANTWAKSFWYGTLNAAKKAIKNPGVYQTSGRLRYVFNSDLMGGTLLCFMPDGRPLAYPMAKLVEEENKFGKTVEAISYLNKSTRHTLWYGILVENPVQGYAASLLRDLLVRLDEHDCTVFHTHDEAGLEVPMRQQNYWVEKLGEMMEDAPAHAAGLPLKADIKSDVWYHK